MYYQNQYHGPLGQPSVSDILANAPSTEVEATNTEEDGFESYIPTIYQTIWGKDDEEKLIKTQARLDYFLAAVGRFPFLAPLLQIEIDRVNAEIKSLKSKALWLKVRRYGIGASALGLAWVMFTWGVKNLRSE